MVHELRAAIDAADRAVLDALNRRIAAVRRLHDHKMANGYALSDPSREAAIVSRSSRRTRGRWPTMRCPTWWRPCWR